MRKTKIVCTIGPASCGTEILSRLISAGLDVARLNFSHGSYEEHKKVINAVRNLSKKFQKPICIIGDLCGPKIRIGELLKECIELKAGAKYVLTSKKITGDETIAGVSYDNLAKEVSVGKKVLIDDGLIELLVIGKNKTDLVCKVINGGRLYPHKGVNFPATTLKIGALTKKDIEDVEFAVKNKLDYIAMSFVKTEKDVLSLTDLILSKGAKIPVIVKIEKHEACKNIEEIVKVADGVMVARGDLGVEVPIEEVPLIQKKIIKLCNEYSKPVITATQMLDSMIRNPRPTRAEVTDIANAIFDGTDAIMLSGETASGLYPVEAVKTMAKVAQLNERALNYEDVLSKSVFSQNVTEAISLATCEIAEELKARAILTFTSSGRTAKRISKYKPRAKILAATDNEETKRRLNLSWGVCSFTVTDFKDSDKMISASVEAAKKLGYVKDGDLIVVTAGIPAGVSGSTNMIKVHIVGYAFLRGTGFGKEGVISGKICKARNFEEARKKLDFGDILLVNKLDEKYANILKKVKAVIVAEGHLNNLTRGILEKLKIGAVTGVPHAMDAFRDNSVVTMDVARGLVYEAK